MKIYLNQKSLGIVPSKNLYGPYYNYVNIYYNMYMKLSNEDYKRMQNKLTKEVIVEPKKKKKLTLRQIFFQNKKKNKSK